MNKFRELSFPCVVLGTWLLATAYTLASLGEAHERVQKAQAPRIQPPAVAPPAPTKPVTSKAQKETGRGAAGA